MDDEVAGWVDTDRYPVDDPGSTGFRDMVEGARQQLKDTGAVELSGFMTAEGVAALVADARMLAPRAHRSHGVGTAYLELPDEAWAADHPRKRWDRYAVGAVPYDVMPTTSALRLVYEWDPLLRLVEAIVDRGPLFRYGDPFGALNLAVMTQGDELQWHFDQTDFVVSLAIQAADGGGEFEVHPRIRSPHDERYDRVGAVLDGDGSGCVTLPMVAGTLLVFEGRHSLHRVSPVVGDGDRLVGLLAYDTVPGAQGSDLLRSSRYGRTEPFATPPVQWPVPSMVPVS